MKHGFRLILFMTLLACFAVCASPAVVQVGSNGFQLRHEVSINAPRAKVYDALVGQVGNWWSSDHTFSKDSKNLSIDARPGGCFCEKLPNRGGVEHLRVTYVAPRELLRMSGALGPLQASGLAGSMTWNLSDNGGSTKLEVSYSVGGFMQGGLEQMASPVDSVLGEQIGRLKLFVETGQPASLSKH